MKKNTICLLFAFLLFILHQPAMAIFPEGDEQEKNENTSTLLLYPKTNMQHNFSAMQSDYELGIMNIQLDAMGFLFVGPQFALDFQFANTIAVGPYFRWHFAGLVYQGIVTEWFSAETTTSLASYSFGAQARGFIPIGSGQHRPFFGFGFERSIGADSWDPGGTWGERIYEYKTNVFHVSLGYRLLTESSFNLTAGLQLALAKDTESIGYYEFGEDPIDYYPLETRFLPILQVVMGWQIGN